MEAVQLTNKMIRVYNSTPVEKYPEARALDLLDKLPLSSPTRIIAFKLFQEWLEVKEV